MRHFLLTILAILLETGGAIYAQTARLQGKVLDENLGGEPVSFANIVLLKGEEQIAGTSSDLDGNYNFSNIQPGTYSILISYVGLPNLQINNLELLTDKVTIRNFTFPKQDSLSLQDTIFIQDEKPIKDTTNQIKTLGTRSIGDVLGLCGCRFRIVTESNIPPNLFEYKGTLYIDGMQWFDIQPVEKLLAPIRALQTIKK